MTTTIIQQAQQAELALAANGNLPDGGLNVDTLRSAD